MRFSPMGKAVKALVIIIMAAATAAAGLAVLTGRDIISDEYDDVLAWLVPDEESSGQKKDPAAADSVSGSDLIEGQDSAEEQLSPPVPMPFDSQTQQALIDIAAGYECNIAQIAVINDGYVTNTLSFGYADVSSGKLMNDDTKIRVASLSKVFVGIAAMRAHQDGYLNLDRTLTEQLGYRVVNPSYTKQSLTMRDILTHTATFNDYATISGRSLQNFLQDGESYFYSAIPKTKESWSYSNGGIRAAGGIVEVLTGRTMNNYMDECFFDPMNIDASFFAKLIDDTDNIATLYYGNKLVSQSVSQQLSRQFYEFPGANCSVFAGGLTISAKDYARMMCILIRDGEYDGTQYLLPETVADMEKVCFELDKFDQCTVIRHHSSLYGRELYYHTGDAYGVLSFAGYDADAGEGVVIITIGAGKSARDDVGVHKISAEIASYLFSNVLDGQRNN